MDGHVDDELPEYLLGTLPPEDKSRVERHLARCEDCVSQRDGLRHAVEALAASVTPRAPAPPVRERLMSFVRGEGRFADLLPDVARVFDVDLAEARRLVAQLPDPQAWMEGPAPGILVLPVQGGPRREGAFAAFVRLSPGTSFQLHVHHGEESNFVLQGGFREDSGVEVWAGEYLEKSHGTTHSYVALEGPDCIAASVVVGTIELKDELKDEPKDGLKDEPA